MTEHRLLPTYLPSMAVTADGVVLAVQPAHPTMMRIDRVCRTTNEIKLLIGELAYDHPAPPRLPDGHTNIGLVLVLRATTNIVHRNIATTVDWPDSP